MSRVGIICGRKQDWFIQCAVSVNKERINLNLTLVSKAGQGDNIRVKDYLGFNEHYVIRFNSNPLELELIRVQPTHNPTQGNGEENKGYLAK